MLELERFNELTFEQIEQLERFKFEQDVYPFADENIIKIEVKE